MPNELVCGDCGEIRPVSEFSPKRGMRTGYRRECKKCATVKARKWITDNPDMVLNSHLKRKYGITLDYFNELMRKQAGVCAICKRAGLEVQHKSRSGSLINRLYVDHDHKTGQVRGLLCHPCNAGVGMLQDDPAMLRLAADYLEKGA